MGVIVKKKMNVVPIEKINPMVREKRKMEARKKLVKLLIVFFVFIVIIVYFQSDYSKIKELTINGNLIIRQDEIIEWSGFKENDYFLKLRTEKMKEMLEKHGEIKKVTFKRSFPNKMSVTVVEYKQFAYLIKNGKYYPVLENAYVLKEETEALNSSPLLQDFNQDEYLDETVLELGKLPKDILLCISEVQYTPSDIDKNILTLYMNDGMQVLATITKLSNLQYYPDMISNIPDGKKGLLDLQVGTFFKPFEEEVEAAVNALEAGAVPNPVDSDTQNPSGQNATN
jgi:cell division protein FtsQ